MSLSPPSSSFCPSLLYFYTMPWTINVLLKPQPDSGSSQLCRALQGTCVTRQRRGVNLSPSSETSLRNDLLPTGSWFRAALPSFESPKNNFYSQGSPALLQSLLLIPSLLKSHRAQPELTRAEPTAKPIIV